MEGGKLILDTEYQPGGVRPAQRAAEVAQQNRESPSVFSTTHSAGNDSLVENWQSNYVMKVALRKRLWYINADPAQQGLAARRRVRPAVLPRRRPVTKVSGRA